MTMKVMLVGEIFPDSFAKNILSTLESLGHKVVSSSPTTATGTLDVLRRYASAVIPNVELRRFRKLVSLAKRERPDLIVNPGYHLPPDIVDALKAECSARVVVWWPDSIANFGRQYIMASQYDAFFFKDRHIVDVFAKKLVKPAYFLPQAFNPLWHRTVELSSDELRKYSADIAIAGNMYYYRAKVLETFLEKGVSVKIWGGRVPKWLKSPLRASHQGQYVAELEKSKVFNSSSIVLNLMHYTELLGVNLRAFEAAGCGAFQILDWIPNIDELFEPDQEVVVFKSQVELHEKVKYYLSHPGHRKEIAKRGQERAKAEHTYEQRVRKLISLSFNGVAK